MQTVLRVVAIVEILVGLLALIAAWQLLRTPDAGMAAIYVPVLWALGLLVLSGVALWIQRPWSYWVLLALPLLITLVIVAYVGRLWPQSLLGLLLAALMFLAVTLLPLLLPGVRRSFGVSG